LIDIGSSNRPIGYEFVNLAGRYQNESPRNYLVFHSLSDVLLRHARV
jgi:hypothetical protein